MNYHTALTTSQPYQERNVLAHHSASANSSLLSGMHIRECFSKLRLPPTSSIGGSSQGAPGDLFPPYSHVQQIGNRQHVKLDRKTLKHRRFQSEAYSKYRTGHANKKSLGSDQVWPDEWEEVFWDALLEHPPRGRTKESKPQGSKLTGRNEDIADYMKQCLSEAWDKEMERKRNAKLRDGKLEDAAHVPRKFISSHIQVLKIKFQDDPYILDLLSEDKQKRRRKSKGRTRKQTDDVFDTTRQLHTDGIPMHPILYPSFFRMQVERAGQVIGTYCDTTQSTITNQPEINVKNIPKALRNFLMLPKHKFSFFPGQFGTLWAQVTLKNLANMDYRRAAITVDSRITTNLPMSSTQTWHSEMSYFHTLDARLRTAVDGTGATYGPIAVGQMMDSTNSNFSCLSCVFGSSFWAKEFARIRELVSSGLTNSIPPLADGVSHSQSSKGGLFIEDTITARLEEIVGVQQIWSHATRQGEDRPIWVILWSFSASDPHSSARETPTAITWRKLRFDAFSSGMPEAVAPEKTIRRSPMNLPSDILLQTRHAPNIAMQSQQASQAQLSQVALMVQTPYQRDNDNACLQDFSNAEPFLATKSFKVTSYPGSAGSSLIAPNLDQQTGSWSEREISEHVTIMNPREEENMRNPAESGLSSHGLASTFVYDDSSNLHLPQPEMFFDFGPSDTKPDFVTYGPAGDFEWNSCLSQSHQWSAHRITTDNSVFEPELGLGFVRFPSQHISTAR